LSDYPIHIVFEPVMAWMQTQDEVTKLDVVNAAIKVYESHQDLMWKLLARGELPRISYFDWACEGRFTLWFEIVYNTMVLMSVEIDTPPGTDSEGHGPVGTFIVRTLSGDRCFKARIRRKVPKARLARAGAARHLVRAFGPSRRVRALIIASIRAANDGLDRLSPTHPGVPAPNGIADGVDTVFPIVPTSLHCGAGARAVAVSAMPGLVRSGATVLILRPLVPAQGLVAAADGNALVSSRCSAIWCPVRDAAGERSETVRDDFAVVRLHRAGACKPEVGDIFMLIASARAAPVNFAIAMWAAAGRYEAAAYILGSLRGSRTAPTAFGAVLSSNNMPRPFNGGDVLADGVNVVITGGNVLVNGVNVVINGSSSSGSGSGIVTDNGVVSDSGAVTGNSVVSDCGGNAGNVAGAALSAGCDFGPGVECLGAELELVPCS
jgi:hypothetical protein